MKRERLKLGLTVLALLIVVVGLSSVVVYSAINREEGSGDRVSGSDTFPLVAPPFVGVASAAEAEGGGPVAAAGTTFLEEEAGIAAYVNVGQQIDLEDAEMAFKSIETVSESYIIGEIDLPGLPEYVDPHAYVHKDGWIVTYYSNYAPVGKIMEWYEYDGGAITTTTLADAMHIICDEVEVNYAVIKNNIKYYDFEYPNANRMMLITDTVYGNQYQSDFFNLEIPIDCWLYEGSWSHYFSGDLYLPYGGYSVMSHKP